MYRGGGRLKQSCPNVYHKKDVSSLCVFAFHFASRQEHTAAFCLIVWDANWRRQLVKHDGTQHNRRRMPVRGDRR